MLWNWIFLAFVDFVNVLFGWLPTVQTFDSVSVAGVVFNLGTNIDSSLVTTFGVWNGFLQVFWPLQIVWTMMLWYYGLKVALLGMKFIPYIGTRVQV